MKNSFLLQQCRQKYTALQQQIQSRESQSPDEIKWIEWGFGVTLHTWLNIEKMIEDYQFMDHEEEVCFYKTQKPRFTALIDYFSLLYKSALFQPEDRTEREAYWISELETCLEIMSRFKTACLPYEQQQPSEIYFLRHNNQQSLTFGITLNQFDLTNTSCSSLLGRLIALKKYKKFIQEKIFKSTLERSHFAA
jgi:hypothetical protein